MMKTGARMHHRLLSLLLALVLLVSAGCMPAQALEGWETMTVSVTWTDDWGNLYTESARKVEGSDTLAYWVQLSQEALGRTITLEVYHPDPSYRFYLENGTQSIQWTAERNAASLDTQYAYYMGYDINGVFQNEFIQLYVSTQFLDQQESFVEGVVSSAVRVPVRYVDTDGRELDAYYMELYPNTMTPVYAGSAKVAGYTLLGDGYVDVYVDASGQPNPEMVEFLYEAPRSSTPTPEPLPAEAVIPVYYYHADGTLLDMQEKVLTEGWHTIRPESGKVGSYKITGAAGERDIGYQFPDNSGEYKNIDSRILLARTRDILRGKNLTVEYADMTVVAQKPKLGPYIEAMRQEIARVLEIDVSRVNVKATTEEHMGFTGRGEGIAAHAVCLLA